MKKIKNIFAILIFLFPLCYHAQFFGLIQKVPQQHYWVALNYPQDGKYRALNCIQWSTANANYYRRSQVLIYNANYQLVDSVNLMRGVIPWQSAPLKIGNRLYWASYAYDTIAPNPNTTQLVILELDTNYNHVALHKVNNKRYFNTAAPFRTNLVYMNGRFYVNQLDYYNDTSINYKLTSQFVKVDSVVLKGLVHEIRGIGGKLMLHVQDFPSPCADAFGGRLEKLMMDTSYNFSSCFTFSSLGYHNYGPAPSPIEIVQLGGTSLLPISKTKTLAVGMMSVFHTLTAPPLIKKGLVNCIISDNDVVIKGSVYSSSLMNIGYCNGSNVVAIKGNEIITAGTAGFDSQKLIMSQTENNKIYINKLDTLGNLIWQKQCGDSFFYAPSGIAFTADGGCLVSGIRYPKIIGNQIPLVEGFLLKLDANGEYVSDVGDVGIVENGKINQKINCYPNPSKDKVLFDIPFQENIEIAIQSTLGSEVLKTKEYTNLSPLDVSGLPDGVYFYRVQTKTNNYSGKFVKE